VLVGGLGAKRGRATNNAFDGAVTHRPLVRRVMAGYARERSPVEIGCVLTRANPPYEASALRAALAMATSIMRPSTVVEALPCFTAASKASSTRA
jgi:hypothetical protein